MLTINQYVEKIEVEIIKLKEEIERRKNLKEKIMSKLNTEIQIPDYVVEDIIDGEDYNHICLMINTAAINNRISQDDAKKLKKLILNKFEIKNIYESISVI